jgi:hypothetical protein
MGETSNGTSAAECIPVTTTRPAQSALIPSLAATPDQLTAANVVAGWLEAAGAAAAGLLVGVLISLAGVGSVFAVCAGLGLAAALLVAGLRATSLAAETEADASTAGVAEGLRLAVRQPRLRLMLALLTADAVVVGALDLLVTRIAAPAHATLQSKELLARQEAANGIHVRPTRGG